MGWAGLVLWILSRRHAVQTNRGPFKIRKNAAATLDRRTKAALNQVPEEALARSIRLAFVSWSWNLRPSCQHVVVRWKMEECQVLSPLHFADRTPDAKVTKENKRIKETKKEDKKIQEVYHIPHRS